MRTLAEELQDRMGDQTQIEFAEKLGIAQSTLSEILSGKKVPGLNKTASAIAQAYPELAVFFLPENIAGAKAECPSDNGDTSEAA